MIEANTSYKQNGVPVSIPSGSYGIAPLTVHQYEYPKGHPCHNCPYTLRTSVPSCMFPERRDGGCLWYDLKKQRRPPLPAVYPKNQAAAEAFLMEHGYTEYDLDQMYFEEIREEAK